MAFEIDVIIHKSCFKCHHCDVTLSLNTAVVTTDEISGRKLVFCGTHAPKVSANLLGPKAFAIRNAVEAQKINKQTNFNNQVTIYLFIY